MQNLNNNNNNNNSKGTKKPNTRADALRKLERPVVYNGNGGSLILGDGEGYFSCVLGVTPSFSQREMSGFPFFIALKIMVSDTKSEKEISAENDFLISKIVSSIATNSRSLGADMDIKWSGFSNVNPFVNRVYNSYWIPVRSLSEEWINSFIPHKCKLKEVLLRHCRKSNRNITPKKTLTDKNLGEGEYDDVIILDGSGGEEEEDEYDENSDRYRLYVMEMDHATEGSLTHFLSDVLKSAPEIYMKLDHSRSPVLRKDIIDVILLQLCESLHFLSSTIGLVHRDIKFGNLVVTKVDLDRINSGGESLQIVYDYPTPTSLQRHTIPITKNDGQRGFPFLIKLIDYGLSDIDEKISQKFNYRKNALNFPNKLVSPIDHLLFEKSQLNNTTCDIWAIGNLCLSLILYGWKIEKFRYLIQGNDHKKSNSEELVYTYYCVGIIFQSNSQVVHLAHKIQAAINSQTIIRSEESDTNLKKRKHSYDKDSDILSHHHHHKQPKSEEIPPLSTSDVINVMSILQVIFFMKRFLAVHGGGAHSSKHSPVQFALGSLSSVIQGDSSHATQNTTILYDLLNLNWKEILDTFSDDSGINFFEILVEKIVQRGEIGYLQFIDFCFDLRRRKSDKYEQKDILSFILSNFFKTSSS